MTKVDDVVMYRRGQRYSGTLHMTTHHIIFTVMPTAGDDVSRGRPLEFWFCYPMIERVEFNRGSAMLFERKINAELSELNLGVTESITSSSFAATASGFTSTLTSGLGNMLSNINGNGNANGNGNGDGSASLDRRADVIGVSEQMIQLSVTGQKNGESSRADDQMNEEQTMNQGEKKRRQLEMKQRELSRGACIRLQFRDFNYIALDFTNILKGTDVFESMMRLTCIDGVDKLYAFIYQPVKIETQFNGWENYDMRKEFERQGLQFGGDVADNGLNGHTDTKGCAKWRITRLNEKYQICESYPRSLVVPRSISDTMLKHTVRYRSKNRFPALSYFYKENGCSIVRCSQPLVGIKQNRSLQDEKMIEEIFKSNGNVGGRNLIVDCRPVTNAMAQVALGAGTEIMDGYGENTKKVFLNIENIHVMRDSLNKVKMLIKNSDVDGCNVSIDKEQLLKSGWMDHVGRLLKATDLLVKSIVLDGNHLIVHCSDGWDRTSQLCSLVELCIDPYFRTIEGFIVLIEKEWISFGHRFNERCGHLQRETKFFNHTEEGNFQTLKHLNQRFKNSQNMKLESPVFQQFLDCVYQLMIQHSTAFEFNERFLRRLVYHLYSCQYGTFLVDKERERDEYGLKRRTRSVWDYFESRRAEFTNAAYSAPSSSSSSSSYVLDVGYSGKHAPVWWCGLFGREL